MEQQTSESNINRILNKLSNRMSLFGKILVILGVIYLIGGLITIQDNYGNIFEGLLQIFLGYITIRVSILFKTASEKDILTIDDLTIAFEGIIRVYTFQIYFYGFIFFLALFTLISLAWTNLS
ncbi:hypothetical protein EHQ59_07615 [Leptospira kemamanensis]|uniref:Uncharacterized protein n=1 Tax=Leptospira kemamanensis TaxID=2484942 RepID=A0A4R9JS58_9LEPT|nr:hypothetical protein [Leptospira kemamanensis]TGL54052.1 hypothetical protein EHQ59_07615 [Leptospira kemamanensis]